jgi:DNA invertase Pin-like site-specific DNA recombinase
MTRHDFPAASPARPSSKIREWHWLRWAIVYVRQSTAQQVLEHRESTARQYDLVEVAMALGWPRERILVIDEDQGHSGQSAEGRPGFQRLLAEVGLDHVGIVLCLEVSRLARCCKDWHQLLELCAMFRTLLADQDGVYDPTEFNDRLLLGLKGTMSEAELHILQGRMAEGRRNKAQRGELFNHAPIGYVREPGGGYALDPDEQVQNVVRLIFEQFERLGTVHAVLRHLVRHDIRVPVRPHFGPERGQLQWRRPNRVTLLNLLEHPAYAGAYRWGHRKIDPRRKKPGQRSSGRTFNRPEDCEVLLHDRLDAYITWEQFQANQKRLADNCTRAQGRGAPRQGSSLLSGLVVCGRCGRRMSTSYNQGGSLLRYQCSRDAVDYAGPVCQGLAGAPLDALVGEQILLAIEPASLELSLAAADDLERERDRLHAHWRQRLERAAQEADRSWRQYHAVEPENRLVARELERRWEAALAAQRQLQEEHSRFLAEQPATLTAQQRQEILALADDLPGLWSAATTTPEDRQQIARLLLEQVSVRVIGQSEQVEVTLHWAGGTQSEHRLARPVDGYAQLSYYPRMRAWIEELREQGLSMEQIAQRLNEAGFRPPKRAAKFTGAMVTRLLADASLSGPRPAAAREGALEANEWWLSDLARHLNMPIATLTRWRIVGWVHARKAPVSGGRWAIWVDAEELDRLRRLRDCPLNWRDQPLRRELAVPKPRPVQSAVDSR